MWFMLDNEIYLETERDFKMIAEKSKIAQMFYWFIYVFRRNFVKIDIPFQKC